ncbi:MAG: undecaprenyldiphospho-muramoylpentapeptide beta-N-acetylglucosaminyltransferase [Anaerolineae bacterium]|nr:undecaprenyldiphospho-muramoylpentapeptide beta-N-acetylglucosaminyltransferase [Anaerolineae bacterium]
MRILVTGGGTGGHVYPALSVLEVLRREGAWFKVEEVAWVGEKGGIEERIVSREEVPFIAVSSGPLRGISPGQALCSVFLLARGIWQALRVVQRFAPDVVLSTGGYVSVPLVLAAWVLGRPVLIYLPDMEPGLAVRFLSLFAQRVAVSFEQVCRYFKKDKVFVSGYPVRRALYVTSKREARQRLGVPIEEAMVLVLGGSRGAHSINEAVRRDLQKLLQRAWVIHISGHRDYEELAQLKKGLEKDLARRYLLFAYMYEHMTDALAAADVVVARAGAATLGEFPAVGVPAILVPYPYAGQHQEVNARYLQERGAALVIEDEELSERLLLTVQALLDDREHLQAMGKAMRALAMPQAAELIARELSALAKGKKRWKMSSAGM